MFSNSNQQQIIFFEWQFGLRFHINYIWYTKINVTQILHDEFDAFKVKNYLHAQHEFITLKIINCIHQTKSESKYKFLTGI